MSHRAFVVSIAFVLSTFAACGPNAPQEHPDESGHAAEAELEPRSVTVFGERALLFVEHPHLVRGESARFLAHLTVLATGEPVRAGRVVLEVGPTALSVDAPKRDGLFVPEGTFLTTGTFAARLTVTSDQANEVIELGEMRVHSSTADARAAAQADAPVEAPGEISFLLEQQWKLRLLIAEAGPSRLSRRLVVPASVRLPDGATATVRAPVAGRLQRAAEGQLPITGTRVASGQILGFLEPPLSATDLAGLQTMRLELELRALDLVREAGEARLRLGVAERELERLRALRTEGLSTLPELEQAQRDAEVARQAEESARSAEAALERLAAERGGTGGPSGFPGLRLALAAPLDGLVVAAPHVQGESVPADAELFRVIDTSRVWIEGRVSEFDLHRLRPAARASATLLALPGRRLELEGPAYIGPQVDPESRTVLVRLELDNAGETLKHGMLAELELETASVAAAVAIPFEAVVMDQGMPTAFVMLSGETFQRRELELGVRDGDQVQVLQGLAPGERVATRGAYIVRLAALAPVSFGHGHAH